MRLPRSKSNGTKSAEPGPVSKSQAALSGPDGDGKEHDLQYWIESGFLTLPAGAFDTPAKAKATAAPIANRPGPGSAR
jgi:hypothetical protein